MKTAKQKIDNIRQFGYELDFGDTFNKAFEIYKQIAVNAGVAALLFTLVVGIVMVGTVGAIVGFSSITTSMTDFDLENISSVYVALYVLLIGVFGGLGAPFTAGLIKMAHCAYTNQDFSIGTAFDYYKGRYFGELFIAIFLISIVSIGISTILDFVLFVPMLGSIINILISLFTVMTIPLIIFGNLRAVDAIVASCIVVSRSPLMIVGLIIVAILAACVGLIAFCIGAFFTFPIVYATYYSIYVNSVGIDDKTEMDDIGTEWN
ncbi:MAG TPA: hypothetical protein VF581_04275 [Flavobacterium sp.]